MEREEKDIIEGLAKIKTAGHVFYNPVQEFNRDLSVSAIMAFIESYNQEKPTSNEGIYILEALSATGLRSIRYAKEISGVRQILANDISAKAVQDIKNNIVYNNIGDKVSASHCDATMLMYQHKRENQFDVIDLDPYGCPSVFLDSAVQAVKEGGLLLVTATDMAVLAGNSPETCYLKYGSVSLKIKCCHEMAVRILLQCIESHANRYGRYIIPLLSVSADFYVRVFVKVYSGAQKCKYTTSKLSHVYHCTGCDCFTLHTLGVLRNGKNNSVKFALPTGPPVSPKCEHCGHTHHIGGPIWSAPIHCKDFVGKVLHKAPEQLRTYRRIEGVLSVILEELIDVPLYYTLEKMTGTLHVESPPILSIRSALLNAGYRVSFTHMNKGSIKSDAPNKIIWDILRCWAKIHPVSEKRLVVGTPAFNILSISTEKEYSFDMHPEANPRSRKMGFLRFQMNPTSHWGPGCRDTAMIGSQNVEKSKKNQGKRKRGISQESMESRGHVKS